MAKESFASSLNSLTPLILGGAALYFLSKSNFFKGLGQAGTGIGTGVSGIGEGVSEAFTGVGSGLGQVGENVGGFTDILQPFSALGQETSKKLREQSANDILLIQQRGEEKLELDKIKSEGEKQREIAAQKEKTLRSSSTQKTKTLVSENLKSEIKFASNVGKTLITNPIVSFKAGAQTIASAGKSIISSVAKKLRRK